LSIRVDGHYTTGGTLRQKDSVSCFKSSDSWAPMGIFVAVPVIEGVDCYKFNVIIKQYVRPVPFGEEMDVSE
jgi:hypothetical protein